MITLITGVPGSGKSAALVDMLCDWQAKGRRIYANGIPELQVAHEVLEDGQVQSWHEPGLVDDGSVIVIDEVQRIWRPAPSGQKPPAAIAELETHRHRGLDFYIVTQNPNLVHANVRRLVGRHVHLRDLGLMGRWWYEWPEAANVERFRDAPVKKRYSISKRAIALYKSASVHIKPVRSLPRAAIVVLLCVPVLGYLVYRAYSGIAGKVATKPVAGAAAASAPGTGPRVAPVAPGGLGGPPGGRVLSVSAPIKDREPYAGYEVVLAGSWSVGQARRSWFTLRLDGQRVAVLPDAELMRAGYSFRYIAPCVGVLVFGELERLVRCAPLTEPAAKRGEGGPSMAASSPNV